MVTVRESESALKELMYCSRCGKLGADLTIQGNEKCYECGNEIDLCRPCARELAAELLKAAQEPPLRAEVDALRAALSALLPFAEKFDDEGPLGEGWQSKALEKAIADARVALAGKAPTSSVEADLSPKWNIEGNGS